MSMTAQELRALADLGLSTEQMKGVLELLASRIETDDNRRAVQAERKRQSRDKAKTVTGQSQDTERDEAEMVLSPPSPPSPSFSPTPPITTPSTPISEINNSRDPSKPLVSRGSRLPDDFQPLPNVIEDARNRGLTDSEIADELDAIKVWASNAGSKGFKKDWHGFTRIWLRKWAAEKKEKLNGSRKTTDNRADGFAQVRAVIAEAERRELADSGTVGEENVVSLPRLRQVAP